MSMFDNKTKPELERGNFIAYADEPNTIVDSAGGGGGGGGGGAAFFMMHYDADLERNVAEFTYNQVKEAFMAGQVPYVKLIYDQERSFQGNLVLVTLLSGTEGSYNILLSDNGAFYASDPDAIME